MSRKKQLLLCQDIFDIKNNFSTKKLKGTDAMSWKNCEKCGREIAPNSGVTHATFFESLMQKNHYFCCKACKEKAIKDGDIKSGSNGCLVVIFIIVFIVIVLSRAS